jgi:hypothetical protein
MEKTSLLISLLILTIFSQSGFAGVIFVPVGGLIVPDEENTSQVEKTINNDTVIISIKTQGLSAADTLQGFIGNYDLALKITLLNNETTTANPVIAEIIEGSVKGRSRGRIDGLLEQPLNLKARIKGEAYCMGQGENPCNTLAVILDLKGVLFFAPLKPAEFVMAHAGSLNIKITGTFFSGSNIEPPAWKQWAYSGELGLLETTTQ